MSETPTFAEAIYFYYYTLAADENYRHVYHVRLRFSSVNAPRIDELAELLFALEQANEVGCSLVSHRHPPKKRILKRPWIARSASEVPSRDRVRVDAVQMQSPLDLTLIITSLGGLWVLVQIIDKVQSWPLARTKTRMEIQKLEHEIKKLRFENTEKERALGRQLEKTTDLQTLDNLASQKRATGALKIVIERLERSEFRLEDIEVHRTQESDENHRD